VSKFGAYGGLLSKWVKYTKILKIYLFLSFCFQELTYRSDPSTVLKPDGSNDVDMCNGVPFGGFIDLAPHFGGKISRNSNVGVMNRHCQHQAKQAKF